MEVRPIRRNRAPAAEVRPIRTLGDFIEIARCARENPELIAVVSGSAQGLRRYPLVAQRQWEIEASGRLSQPELKDLD